MINDESYLLELFLQLQLEVDKLYKSVSSPDNADQLLSQLETKMSAIKTRINEWEQSCAE